jgi:hypothetical protein
VEGHVVRFCEPQRLSLKAETRCSVVPSVSLSTDGVKSPEMKGRLEEALGVKL